MKRKNTDRHLDVPAEANRDKHINFVALENNQADPADEQRSSKSIRERENEQHQDQKNKKTTHQKLTDNPRHATDESSTEADSPQDGQ